MSKDRTEGGPPAPAIRKAVTLKRYSYGGGPEPIAHEPDDATPSADADRARARELSELGDYVRLLADRMGLKDWTFDDVSDEGEEYCEAQIGHDEVERLANLDVEGDRFFGLSPERRRFVIVRELLNLHFRDAVASVVEKGLDGYASSTCLAVPIAAIAAAWAPCLPLPLVGWMRRAKDER